MTLSRLLLPALLLCPAPVRAQGLPEFELALLAVRAAVLPQAFLRRPGARPKADQPKPAWHERVAPDQAAWERMLARVRNRPTFTRTLRVGGTDYTVYGVVAYTALPRQQCAADERPRNALFVTVPSGKGAAIYPFRLSSDCVGPVFTAEKFAVDADAEGWIQDGVLYVASRAGKEKLLALGADPLEPGEMALFRSYLSDMVGLFAAP